MQDTIQSFRHNMTKIKNIRFQDKTQQIFSLFLTIFVKLLEICLILVFVYSLNFLDFLCISFEVDALDKRFKVSASAVLTV